MFYRWHHDAILILVARLENIIHGKCGKGLQHHVSDQLEPNLGAIQHFYGYFFPFESAINDYLLHKLI